MADEEQSAGAPNMGHFYLPLRPRADSSRNSNKGASIVAATHPYSHSYPQSHSRSHSHTHTLSNHSIDYANLTGALSPLHSKRFPESLHFSPSSLRARSPTQSSVNSSILSATIADAPSTACSISSLASPISTSYASEVQEMLAGSRCSSRIRRHKYQPSSGTCSTFVNDETDNDGDDARKGRTQGYDDVDNDGSDGDFRDKKRNTIMPQLSLRTDPISDVGSGK